MSRFGRSLLLLSALITASHAEESRRAEPVNVEVAKLAAMTLQTEHYSKALIDDTISREWFNDYLAKLDYSRIYFLDSDIQQFQVWMDKLDDDILAEQPRLDAAFAIYDRYLQRLDERVDRAMKLLDRPLSFDDPGAKVEIERKDAPWAKSAKELDDIWQARLAEQLLRMVLADDPPEKALERLRKRYERVRHDAHEISSTDILEVYLGSLAGMFDPHSVWFKPISKENFDIDMADSLTGIGAELNQPDGYTTITRLIPGGPAESSGMLDTGDRIVAVAQGDGEPEEVIDMRLDKVVKLIRGPIDTEVVLTIWPGDASDPAERKIVRIGRKKVKLDRSAAKGELREHKGASIGVIDIPSFYQDSAARRAGDENWAGTAKDTAKILTDFKAKGVDVVVVDLRKNGGGRLDESLELTGLFIDQGPVVQIRSRAGRVEVLQDPSVGAIWDGPVVVLTSELSASASEIFAAAIQDHGRGIIVGSETTHGKGTVQDLHDFNRYFQKRGMYDFVDKGGAIKFTTHMFFRPSGGSTQVRGVKADIVLPSPYQGMEIKEGDLDHALLWDNIRAANYKRAAMPMDIPALAAASSARVKGSMEFAFMFEDIMERQRVDEMKHLSLHLPTRRDEIERGKAIEDAREKARKAAGWDAEEEVDPILDEAIAIAADAAKQTR